MPDQHVIGSGLTEQELKMASWWVRNHAGVIRTVHAALIGVSILTWGYVLWTLLDTYVISQPRESRIVQHILQNNLTSATFDAAAPQPLAPSEVTVSPSTDGRQDMILQLSNSNTAWWATFDYHFQAQDQNTPVRQGYILPNSQRYITELGWKGTGPMNGAQLVLENITWHRLNPADVDRDYASFAQKRLQLTFDNVTYTKDLVIGTQHVGQTNFVLHNPTGFGFWDTQVTILLYRADSLAAFTTIDVKEIKPNESRPMTINWFDNLTGISKTDIRADVNILDPSAYLPGTRF